MAKKKTVKEAVISEEEKVEKVKKEEKEVEEILEEVKEVEEKPVKEKKKKDKKGGFFKGVRGEMKQVVWPSAGAIAKSTIAVILICIFLCLFFEGITLLAAFIKGLFA